MKPGNDDYDEPDGRADIQTESGEMNAVADGDASLAREKQTGFSFSFLRFCFLGDEENDCTSLALLFSAARTPSAEGSNFDIEEIKKWTIMITRRGERPSTASTLM